MSRSCAGALLVVVGLVVVGSAARAEGTVFGVQIGVGAGYLTGEYEKPPSNFDQEQLGIRAGATVEFCLSDAFCIETGLLYVQKGAFGRPDPEFFGEPPLWDYLSEATIKLDYLDIPVLARFKLAGGKAYLAGGLYLGFLTNAEMEYEYWRESDGTVLGQGTVDMKDAFKDTDFGLVVGAGGSFGVGAGRFSVGVQYSKGLTDVDEGNTPGQNKMLAFVFGYAF